MSQVTFRTEYRGKKAVVMAGWDVPLSGYFLTVYLDDPTSDDYIWSNLDSLEPWTSTIEPYVEQLRVMGIEAPAGFWEKVRVQEGNVFWDWSGDQWVLGV
jgi:hypothetical protein